MTNSTPSAVPLLPDSERAEAPKTAKTAKTAKTVKPVIRSTPAAASKAPATKASSATKAAPKKPARASTTAAVTAAVTAPVKEVAKEAKVKKPKLVRDSFTIPKDEYAVIDALKQRATALAQPVKKSEILRAGLKVLAGLSDNALRGALQAVPSIKTGRPKAEAPMPAPATKTSAKPIRK